MKKQLAAALAAVLILGMAGCSKEDNPVQIAFTTAPEQGQSEHAVIAPLPDPLAGAMEGAIPDGVYHVTADGNADYSADADGQYMVLKFWSYETFDKDAVNQMAVGDVLLLQGEPQRIDALKRSENSLGETTYVDINGGMAEDGTTLAFDYEENCFREFVENDAYVLYSVGARKVKLAADFLYADHSSVANPGDPEPEWARGDAAAFPDYIAGRELYGNNSYAEKKNGEFAALNIEWTP
ncbi:MAG: hypothetical protein ACI3V1_03540 [Faecousia sp.]